MKKFFLLFFAWLLAITMSAGSYVVVFDATVDTGIHPSEAGADTIEKEGVTLSFSQGLANGQQYRFYKASTVTVSAALGTIVKIEFFCTANGNEKYGPGCFEVGQGDYTYDANIGIWTGEAQSVVFTAATNQVRATKVVVTVETDGFLPPTMHPAGGTYYEPVSVSITTSNSDATIHFTTDGSDPTIESPLYSAPFTINATTTVMAIAVLDEQVSSIARAEYVIVDYPHVDSIKDLKDLEDGAKVIFVNPVQVITQAGNRLWVKDESDCVLIYGNTGQTYRSGDVIPGGFMGTKTAYDGVPELIEPSGFRPSTGHKILVPDTVTIPELSNDLLSHYLLFENVMLSYDGSNYYMIDDEGHSCLLYLTTTNFPAPDVLEGRWNVYAVMSAYRGIYQMLPLRMERRNGGFGFGNINDPEIPAGVPLTFDYDATVLLQYNKYLYAKDPTGYALIYGDVGQTYEQGDIIPHGFRCTISFYNGNPQLADPTGFVPASDHVDLSAERAELDDLTWLRLHYVMVSQVTLIPNENGVVSSGILRDSEGNTCQYYDPTGVLNGFEVNMDAVCDVYGVVTMYRNDFEILLTRVDGFMPIPDPVVASIAELYALPANKNAQFETPLTAIYHDGNRLYVKDVEGSFGLVYGDVPGFFRNGDIIIGAVCSWTQYGQSHYLIPVKETFLRDGSGPKVEPEVMSIEEISRDMEHSFVRFNDVTLEAVGGYLTTVYMMSDGTESMTFEWSGRLPKGEHLTMPYERSGEFNIADINALIDVILSEYESWDGKYDVTGFVKLDADGVTITPVEISCDGHGYDLSHVDINQDGEINVADVNAGLDIILSY